MNKKGIYIGISITVCLLAGFLGAIATQSSVHTWFPTLSKPFFNPPNWVFAPVWSILYILMGVASGLIWSKGFHHKWVKTAMYHFIFQLLLNVLWSMVFFGMQEIFIALLIIIGLLVLLLFTYKHFKVVNKFSAYLLIPYILWVSFALALNLAIWKLN